MPVIENNEKGSESEIAAQEKALAENILDNFEIPESLAKNINTAVDNDGKEVVEEKEVESEEKAESVKEEIAEDAQPEEETKAEDSEEDELVPKSKMQKRIDELTARIKQAELRAQKAEEERSKAIPRDEDLVKLEKMSDTELQGLKKQVRLSQLKNANDDSMVSKLFELEEKIDSVIRTAPQRFQENQIRQFNEAVQMSSSEIQNFDKSQKDIFNLAKTIYDTAPELQSSVSGQARAWNLAVQHYKILQEANAGKTKVAELDRKVNTLKKRVSLDGVSRKAVEEPDSDVKIFKKAKNGTFGDKLEFIRKRLGTDAVVDGFMESR